ncbi:reverse transcriptase domain-containing protein [Tanacetum coccineum]
MAMIAMILEVAEGQSALLMSAPTGNALTWWNSYVKTFSYEVAYGMTWKTLKKMTTDKYCPRVEIKKLEIKLWNLKVKGTDVGNVMASKPKTMQDAIEIANDLMDKKIRTFFERQVKNKRKLDNDNQAQKQPPKKQNVARAYSAGSSEKKEYAGTLPNQGHYRSDCPELKNQNHGNQAGGIEARGMVYALGGGKTD